MVAREPGLVPALSSGRWCRASRLEVRWRRLAFALQMVCKFCRWQEPVCRFAFSLLNQGYCIQNVRDAGAFWKRAKGRATTTAGHRLDQGARRVPVAGGSTARSAGWPAVFSDAHGDASRRRPAGDAPGPCQLPLTQRPPPSSPTRRTTLRPVAAPTPNASAERRGERGTRTNVGGDRRTYLVIAVGEPSRLRTCVRWKWPRSRC